MKIAITGGAGFIGSHLTRAYLNAGHDVLVIDSLIHASHKAIDPRARFYQLDIRDSKLQTILQRERPDFVSHHTSQREETLTKESSLVDADVHVRGLLNVLDSCINASVSKIIFASGGNNLYGHTLAAGKESHQQKVLSATEDTPLYPQRPHAISKVAGEGYIRYYTRQYGLTHTILRYADVYGEQDQQQAYHPLSYFISMLSAGYRPTIRGEADEIRDHIFIDDVIRANIQTLGRGKNQTLHISSGQGYTLKQLYQAIADCLKSEIEPAYISSSANASSVILDNTLARRVLKWHPEVDLAKGVRYAVDRLEGVLTSAETNKEKREEYVLLPNRKAASLSIAAAAFMS